MNRDDSMVERIAVAMCDGNWDAKDFNETPNGEEPEEQREYWREKARAAIQAMMTPTDGMIEAGLGGYQEYHKATDTYLDPQPHAIWQAMLTAALDT